MSKAGMSPRNIRDLKEHKFLDGKIISVSISEYSRKYGETEGIDMPHVNSAFSIFALYLMSAGAKLLYGGGPNYKGAFNYVERLKHTSQLYGGNSEWMCQATQTTSSLAALCKRSRSKKSVCKELSTVVRNIRRVKRPVVNLVPFPWSKTTSEEDISRFASFLQVLRMPEVPISPKNVSALNENLSDKVGKGSATQSKALAYYEKTIGLYEMRYLQTCVEHARIILGGKRVEFSGAFPGLFEEAVLTIHAGNPLFILGGFGGAAGLIGDFLVRRQGLRKKGVSKRERSDFIKLRKHLIDLPLLRFGKESTDSLNTVKRKLEEREAFDAADKLHVDRLGSERQMDQVVGFLEDVNLNGKVYSPKGLNNGLSVNDSIKLMRSNNINEAVELTMRGLRWLAREGRI